jgi:phage tail-like protein
VAGGGGFDFEADISADVSVTASVEASVSASASAGLSFGAEIDVGTQSMAPGTRTDPFRGYNFAVEIEGLVAGGFSEVTGLEVELEVQDYREGGINGFVHKRAGPAKYASNLVLKRGMTDSKVLWNWYWNVVHGIVARKNVSILLLDEAGEEKVRWNFEQAYPVKWTGPDLRATTNEVAIESLELAHKGLLNVR